MGILTWIVLGLVAGALAKYILPGRQGGGFLWTTLIGVIGAILGGWIATQIGWGTVSGFDIRSLAVAVGGAILVLIIFEEASKRR